MNSKTSLVALALTAGIAGGCMFRHSAAETAYMANRFQELENVIIPCSLVNGWNSNHMEIRDRCISAAQEQYDLFTMNPEVRAMHPGIDCTPQYGCLRAGRRLDCPSDGGNCSILDENGNIIAGGEQ